MNPLEEFKSHAHDLVVEMDLATAAMMELVAAHDMTSDRWHEAVARQRKCYEAWVACMNEPRKRGIPDGS